MQQFTNWLKSDWKEAGLLAIFAALLLEGGCNVIAGRTIWHRLTALEHSVQELQHEKELEDLRTRSQLDELRQKAQQNSEQVEKVEQKVEVETKKK